jgi:hypothetical protein
MVGLLTCAVACEDSSLTTSGTAGPGEETEGEPSGNIEFPDYGEVLTVAPAEAELLVPEADFQLHVVIGSNPTAVETPTPYSINVLDGTVDVSEDWEIDVDITPNLGVRLSSTTVTFSRSGEYEFTATAIRGEERLEQTIDIAVNAGSAKLIEVEALPNSVRVGEVVTFEVRAYDSAGNRVDPDTLSLQLRIWPDEIVLEGGTTTFETTVPGRYEVHAENDTMHAADIFHVLTGPAVMLDLELGPHDLAEPGDTVSYTLWIEDEFGNPLATAPVEVFTIPDDGVSVTSRRLHFEEEGIFQVYARILGTDLEDDEGPVIVDGYGPIIEIKAPDRGTYQTVAPVMLIGSVYDRHTGVSRITLNGVDLELDDEGGFEEALPPALGINLINIEAWDGRDHRTTAVQSFLYGTEFLEAGERANGGLIARLNRGAIDMLEVWALTQFDTDTIRDAVVPTRVFSYCIDLWLTELCAYGDLDDFTSSGLGLDLDPQDGYLAFTLDLYDLYIHVRIHGDVSLGGAVRANRARVTANVSLWVDEDERIRAGISSLNVSLNNFRISIDGLPNWLNWVVGEISGLARGLVEDAVEDAVADFLPEVLEELLAELTIELDLEFFGANIHVLATPQAIPIDVAGMTLVLGTRVTSDTVAEGFDDALGALATPSLIPAYSASPDFMLSISDDFLNQALFSVWESGALNDLLGDDVADSLDISLLSGLIPGATGVDLGIDPMLPPVFRVGPREEGVGEFQVGDLLIDLYALYDSTVETALTAEVSVSMFGDAQVGISDDNTIAMDISSDLEFYFDGIFSALEGLHHEDLELLLGALLPMILPDLLGGIEAFPLPAFDGFTINASTVGITGPSLDYLNIGGALVPE